MQTVRVAYACLARTFIRVSLMLCPVCLAGFGLPEAFALPQPLALAEVVKMSQSGMDPNEVTRRIRDTRTTYALHGSDFAKLKALGVQDAVLDYLQQSFVDDIDLLTRYWVQNALLGGCPACYPQPIDVDKMESGYAPAAIAPPYQVSRPTGTPDWVPYPQAVHSALITVSDVERMTKDGMPQTQIVERINNSLLTHVIGVGGTLAVRSQPLAGLSGSELAQLHSKGVDYPVLDALQGQFLAQFIEFERLRYQTWGKKK